MTNLGLFEILLVRWSV